MCFGNPQHTHEDAPDISAGADSPLYTVVQNTPLDFEGFSGRRYTGEDGVILAVAIGAGDGGVSLNAASPGQWEGSAEVILGTDSAERLIAELRKSATRDSVYEMDAPFVLEDESPWGDGAYLSVAADMRDASFNTRFRNDKRNPRDSEVLMSPEKAASIADFLASRPGRPANAAGI